MDDVGSTSSYLKAAARCPLQRHFLPRNENSKLNLDRFIPNRSAMDFDYAQSVLRGNQEVKVSSSPSREAYRKELASVLNQDRTRILAFRNPEPPVPSRYHEFDQPRPKPRRCIPRCPEKTLDLHGLVEDSYLNLLDWGASDVLAIALGNLVFFWDASTQSASEQVLTLDQTVTSVSWAADCCYLAVGLNNGEVQLWDIEVNRCLKTLVGCHDDLGVGSLAWNNHILATGGMDGKIISNDVRIGPHVVGSFRGHTQEVSALKWSGCGRHLASGGRDGLVHIWDRSRASGQRQWLHRLTEHTSAVTALAWCPFQSSLLATGEESGAMKFWNSRTGACLNSLDTGAHVSSLIWSTKERELLSSHGNQLTLWKYPSMVKMAELTGHTSSVLFMSPSPNGCTVATAAGAAGEEVETLKFWNLFGVPEPIQKPAPRAFREPFSHVNRIR